MSKAAEGTGIGPTVLVAIEQFFPGLQRGIEDNLAYRILPSGMKAFVGLMRFKAVRNWMVQTSEKRLPGIWGGMICRKRYIDEKLLDAVSHINAVVNLGAGFDTRAFRLPALADTPFYEIDQPGTIQLKKKKIAGIFGSIPTNMQFVPVDFDREDIYAVLGSCGYTVGVKTFFIMEAVTQYLTKEGVASVFAFLAKAATGSRLVFTYIRKDFLDGRVMDGWEKGYEIYVQKNKIWLFGMDPEGWPGFLKQYGWCIIADSSYRELVEKYIKPTGRELASTLIERIVYAEKE